ncbi:hypothetical protein JHK82_039275 [Glycine max]|nr:hypothetical protein JHK86_039453 [Glycine max]KAG4965057.1 hypothetical protein JHK85_040032 [Glycine max]KAG5110052.1 hypothetical protein JHK82_039275 [Glycine max]KAG5121339.1 hypothetical protein JHK84_039679 [Glycine max]
MGSTIFILMVVSVYGFVDHGSSLSRHKILEVERKLNHLRRHSLKTIQSEDGDVIDCIDINKQPAFDHPALKGHKIQKSGRCPEGTILVRRIRGRDMLKANSIEDYGRKKPSFSHQHVGQRNKNLISFAQLKNHSDDEYSTSQVSLLTGPYKDFECVEAGWAVNPSVYGDRQTRLFVYWTADASNKTGCFDLTCPGFVQISNCPGCSNLSHINSWWASKYIIIIYIYKIILKILSYITEGLVKIQSALK